MNKQELIKEFREVGIYSLNIFGTEIKAIPTEIAITSIEQLDEPQPVKVPQCVADWYEENKDDFEFNVWDWIAFRNEPEKLENKEFSYWLNDGEGNPIQNLVNMHQFGYEVEKEPKYKVKLKNTDDYLNQTETGFHFFNNGKNNEKFTRKELEYSGFGEVFNSPLFEVEEVE